MGIADEDIAKVRDATDIVAIISEHLQLKRVGRRWVGLCPFHNEKSPSFSVNQQEGFYHCFGCQKSGDAITFVREIEGLDFAPAVERLAAKAGVTLTYTSANEGARRQKKARLVEAVGQAVDWYHERLLLMLSVSRMSFANCEPPMPQVYSSGFSSGVLRRIHTRSLRYFRPSLNSCRAKFTRRYGAVA